MKKTNILVGSVIVVAALAGFGISYSFSENRTKVEAQGCQDICVDILNTGFKPNELAVKKGEYVQFNTNDGKFHNLALGNGSTHQSHDSSREQVDKEVSHSETHDHKGSLQSGEFGENEGWRVRFDQVGTFIIHDHLNPENTILVVVYSEL